MYKKDIFEMLDRKVVKTAARQKVAISEDVRGQIVQHLACFYVEGRSDRVINSIASKMVACCK